MPAPNEVTRVRRRPGDIYLAVKLESIGIRFDFQAVNWQDCASGGPAANELALNVRVCLRVNLSSFCADAKLELVGPFPTAVKW